MEKKTVLVTGGARGIGKEIVKKFATEGFNIVVNYNKSESMASILQKNMEQTGCSIKTYKADVSKIDEVTKMIDYVLEEYNSIDVVVNNAGITNVKIFTEITENDWDSVINTNLKGPFNVCQQVLKKYMINKKAGTIINIASVDGITGAATEVVYSASKAGVIGMSKALAKELALSNINVNVIAPGAIATDMLYDNYTEEDLNVIKNEIPMNKFGRAEDIAELTYFLASDAAKYITGQVISPNGGIVI